MNWQPLTPSAQSLTCVLLDDPRYRVRAEWVCGRDRVYRRQYRAYYNGRIIGETQPSSSRQAVLDELTEYIAMMNRQLEVIQDCVE